MPRDKFSPEQQVQVIQAAIEALPQDEQIVVLTHALHLKELVQREGKPAVMAIALIWARIMAEAEQ